MTAFSKQQIRNVMIRNNLCSNGVCYRSRDGQVGAPGEVRQEWSRFIGEVNFAASRLSVVPVVKTLASMCGSYGLKHMIERTWTQADTDIDHGYVCNGAVIVAAYLLGIDVRAPSSGYSGPNAAIGVSYSKFRKRWSGKK